MDYIKYILINDYTNEVVNTFYIPNQASSVTPAKQAIELSEQYAIDNPGHYSVYIKLGNQE